MIGVTPLANGNGYLNLCLMDIFLALRFRSRFFLALLHLRPDIVCLRIGLSLHYWVRLATQQLCYSTWLHLSWGSPIQLLTGPMLLDFSDRMGTGVSTWLWP